MNLLRYKFPTALIALVLLSGCAFFNALYNGWAAFDKGYATEMKMTQDGEDSTKITSATEKEYLRAVEKAEKAIRYYPKSTRHHDEAYFLKGRALYQLEGYQEALTAFLYLQKYYQDSKRIPESWLYVGMCYAGIGDFERANEAYTYVIDNYPELNQNQEVLILRADLAIATQGNSQAIPLLVEALENTTDPARQTYIIDRLAGIYMGLKMYGSALEYLEQLPSFHRDLTDGYYRAQMKQVLCYRELLEYEKAETVLERVLDNRYFAPYLLEVKYELAVLYYYQKRIEDARELLEDLVFGDLKTETVAKSWYQLSLIHIDTDGDLEAGEKSLQACLEISTDPELKAVAQERLNGLRMIAQYVDSLENPTDSISEWDLRFKLGERYWLDAKLPDSALVQYDIILGDSTVSDSIRAQTMFAKGWIYHEVMGDTASATELFETVVSDFFQFEVAKGAQKMLDIPVTIMVRRDSAEVRFLEAEELRLATEGYSKDVYYSYLLTALKFPDVEDVAARSLYGAGWVVNQRDAVVEEDSTVVVVDTAAAKIFGRLCREYPESEQCLEVQTMFENNQVKGFIDSYTQFLDEKGAETEPDDSTALVMDSVAVIEDDLPPLEIPDFSGWF